MNIKSAVSTIQSILTGKINPLILITTRCNSKCTICPYWRMEKQDLSVEVIERLLQSKIVNKNGFLIEGGEAILHPQIKDILKLLEGLNYTLLSNGLMPRRLEHLIKCYQIPNISISLDGTRETYRRIRGCDGLRQVLESIHSLKGLTKLSVCFTISPENTFYDYLYVKRICEDNHIDLLLNIFSEMELSGEKVNKPIDKRYDKLPNPYINKYNKWVQGKIKSNCFGQRINCNIFPNGDVVLCQAKPIVLGNLYQESIDEIWRYKKIIKCNDCWISCNRYLEAKWL